MISRTAFACLSDKSNFFIKPECASVAFADLLINSTILSILFSAISNPRTISSLSSAFLKSNSDLFLTTILLYLTYSLIISNRFITLGWFPTSASIFASKLVSTFVNLYNLFNVNLGSTPFFNSITTRTFPLADSSLKSDISGSFFSVAIFAMVLTSSALLTMYGISVRIIDVFPLCSSVVVLALIIILPFPFLYMSFIPGPVIKPPVGKSGPLTICIRSSTVAFGLLMYSIVASATSVRLCGGMFVAIPTAIPVAPFNNKFGNFAGRVVGSFNELSKLGIILTVSFSISERSSSAILLSFASV